MSQENAKMIINNFIVKNKINVNKIFLTKINTGISNYIFKFQLDDKSYFLKIFGILKEFGLVDRIFETVLINLNSKICPLLIETDYENYRIEEYIENVLIPDIYILYNDEFIKKLIFMIINFNTSLLYKPNEYFLNFSIYNRIQKLLIISKDKLKIIKNNDILGLSNKIEIIEFYLENFNNILLDFKFYDQLILSHNDIHKYNLVVNKFNELVMLIDYEYACFNFIGFDIVNYFIETFFDLEVKEYPFYKVENNLNELIINEKYFSLYLLYLDELNKFIFIPENLREKKYYLNIVSFCSLFWFLTALIFLNYDDILSKKGINFLDYSLDRLSIYKLIIN